VPERQPHAALDRNTRTRKARKIVAVIGQDRVLAARSILEIGCGAGVLASSLAQLGHGRTEVHAVDVVDNRIDKDGYDFHLVQGTALPFAEAKFDIVISNHVIEHVGDQADQRHHLQEIKRVLAHGGIVYLAAPNRWRMVEPHFKLPFLSWLPHPASDWYVRLFRRGTHYDCDPPSHARAIALFDSAGFDASDQTVRALRETLRAEMPGPVPRLFDRFVPDWVPRLFKYIMPTYVFLLSKVRSPQAGR
jgi:SAM-dependent methyltransferase